MITKKSTVKEYSGEKKYAQPSRRARFGSSIIIVMLHGIWEKKKSHMSIF